MIKNTFLLFYIICGLLIASCTNKEAALMISRVDSSYTTIKSSEVALLAIDTGEIKRMIRFNTESLDYIQNNFTDSATKEQAIFMSDIVAVKRSFNKLLRQYSDLLEDMIYAKAQLHDLKKDIENDLVTKEQFDSYFETEQKAILMFENSVKSVVSWKNTTTNRFNRMKPEIEQFVEEIENDEPNS